MTSAHDRQFQEKDAEQLLGALAGVVSAHIVTDPTGALAEIHVLATPDLHPKQVVRNVESALSAGLGIEVDRRIVSVAQIRSESSNGYGRAPVPEAEVEALVDADDEGPTTAPRGGRNERPRSERVPNRLEYVRHEARRDAEQCICDVVLRAGGEQTTGRGTGPDTETGRAEAAARAVFDAIGRVRPQLRLQLEGAVLASSRGRQFVIVSAHALLDRQTVPLAGAAALTRSPEEAAILAALQASNRWSA